MPKIEGATTVRNFVSHPLMIPFYLPSLLHAFCYGLLIPILPIYAANFGISYWLIGLVLSAELLGVTLGDVPAGMLNSAIRHKTSHGDRAGHHYSHHWSLVLG